MLEDKRYWVVCEDDNDEWSIEFNNLKDLGNYADDLISQGYEIELATTTTLYLTKF